MNSITNIPFDAEDSGSVRSYLDYLSADPHRPITKSDALALLKLVGIHLGESKARTTSWVQTHSVVSGTILGLLLGFVGAGLALALLIDLDGSFSDTALTYVHGLYIGAAPLVAAAVWFCIKARTNTLALWNSTYRSYAKVCLGVAPVVALIIGLEHSIMDVNMDTGTASIQSSVMLYFWLCSALAVYLYQVTKGSPSATAD